MGEMCPKIKSYPPLIKKKLISTPPHTMIILRLTPPQKSPPIDWFTCWISSSDTTGTNITPNASSTYLEESLEESSESLDFESSEESSESMEFVSFSHELRDSSSSTAYLALSSRVRG